VVASVGFDLRAGIPELVAVGGNLELGGFELLPENSGAVTGFCDAGPEKLDFVAGRLEAELELIVGLSGGGQLAGNIGLSLAGLLGGGTRLE